MKASTVVSIAPLIFAIFYLLVDTFYLFVLHIPRSVPVTADIQRHITTLIFSSAIIGMYVWENIRESTIELFQKLKQVNQND